MSFGSYTVSSPAVVYFSPVQKPVCPSLSVPELFMAPRKAPRYSIQIMERGSEDLLTSGVCYRISRHFSFCFNLNNLSKRTAIDSLLFSAKQRTGSFWRKIVSSEIFWLYFQTMKCLPVPFCNYYAFFTCQGEHWNERDALLLANLIFFPHCFFSIAEGGMYHFVEEEKTPAIFQCCERWEFDDMQSLSLPMQWDTSSAAVLAQSCAF